MAKKTETQKAAASSESKQTEEPKARVLPTFSYKDKDYTFASDTPDPINIDGDLKSLAEIAKDNDTIEYLIEGRNGFVQRVIKKSK